MIGLLIVYRHRTIMRICTEVIKASAIGKEAYSLIAQKLRSPNACLILTIQGVLDSEGR